MKNIVQKKFSKSNKWYKNIGIGEIFPSLENSIRTLVSEKVFQVGKVISRILCQRKFFKWENWKYNEAKR